MKLSVLKSRFTILVIDALMIPIAWYGAYWLRFNLGIPAQNLREATYLLPFLLVTQSISCWFFGLYRGMWGFASLPDLIRIFKAVFIGVLISLIPMFLFSHGVPRSIPIVYAWLLVSFLAGTRFLYRWLKNYRSAFKDGKRVLIVGAGAAGELLLREIVKGYGKSVSLYNPVAFVDDDSSKSGCDIHGIRVAGKIKDIPALVIKNNIEQVIIAMPSVPVATIKEIVNLCKQSEVPFCTIPRLNDLVAGTVSVKTLRDVSIEDLLGRDQVNLNWEQISKGLSGKKVMVTGGGGSIGSELCRQIAHLAPEELVIVDNSEFNLYSVDQDLRLKFPHLRLVSLLINVTAREIIANMVAKYQPQIIFHAAAYKHVPLLEYQPNVAIFNNIYGTYCVAEAAVSNNVESFILVSTDKAVHPTNVMGATKRVAELICQGYKDKAATRFITVRFGNVLGSTGSVVPLFKSQLEQGLDLTVTHPEVSRYFMTIPEAAQLILQATVIGKGSEIFVLDMGYPIKIKDLAEQMIQLSGKKLGEEVNIIYTGLRPGEKLHEELFYETEDLQQTECDKIMLVKPGVKNDATMINIEQILQAAENAKDSLEMKKVLFDIIE